MNLLEFIINYEYLLSNKINQLFFKQRIRQEVGNCNSKKICYTNFSLHQTHFSIK